jgi:LysR family transcriptional regulator, hydrogen peroxide-inducible genes activator
MELHQLRYFTEVVQTGSFTKAAERCNVTQPTLSHQIRKLEELLGEPLLQRRRTGARPTPLGQSFHTRALAILREVDAAREEAAAFAGEIRGSVRIGVIPTIAPYLMPRLLKAALKRFPQLHFHVTEETTDHLLAAMRAGSVDAALLSLPLPGDDWNIDLLMQDELLLALPPRHPLAKKRGTVSLERLADEPLILMKEAHCLSGQTLQVCSRAGFVPQVFLYSSQLETLLALVESGMGLSFIPAMARRAAGSRKVCFRSLRPRAARPIALAWPKRAASTRAFEYFRGVCRSLFQTSK